MIGIALVGYSLFLFALGGLVQWLVAPLFGRWWRFFVAPGVILHELAHAFMAVVMGAQVIEINFWKPTGGHVIHTAPRVHLLGPVLIAFAPMILMSVGLFVGASFFDNSLAEIGWVAKPPETIQQAIGGYFVTLWQVARTLDWTTWVPWLFMYLALNMAVTITPSQTDWQNGRWALGGVLIVSVLVVAVFDVELSLAVIWPLLATSGVFLGMALLPTILIGGGVLYVRRR